MTLNDIQVDRKMLQSGDIVFASESVIPDVVLNLYKIDEHYARKGVSFRITDDQVKANVFIFDKEDMEIFIGGYDEIALDDYPPVKEFEMALSLKQDKINYIDLIQHLYDDMVTIDEEMYNSLLNMFVSKDPESWKLATDIIGNANRSDEATIKYLIALIKDFDPFYSINPFKQGDTEQLMQVGSFDLRCYLEKKYPEEFHKKSLEY